MKYTVLIGANISKINSRKTHCPKGHEYSLENTLKRGGKYPARICRICHNAWNKEHPRPRKVFALRGCVVCGASFMPKRADRVLCGSHKCKHAYTTRET